MTWNYQHILYQGQFPDIVLIVTWDATTGETWMRDTQNLSKPSSISFEAPINSKIKVFTKQGWQGWRESRVSRLSNWLDTRGWGMTCRFWFWMTGSMEGGGHQLYSENSFRHKVKTGGVRGYSQPIFKPHSPLLPGLPGGNNTIIRAPNQHKVAHTKKVLPPCCRLGRRKPESVTGVRPIWRGEHSGLEKQKLGPKKEPGVSPVALGWSLSPLIRARKLLALRYKSSWWGSGYKQHLERQSEKQGEIRPELKDRSQTK